MILFTKYELSIDKPFKSVNSVETPRNLMVFVKRMIVNVLFDMSRLNCNPIDCTLLFTNRVLFSVRLKFRNTIRSCWFSCIVFCHNAFFFVESFSPSSELFHHFRQKIVVKSLFLNHLNSSKFTIHLHETRILQFANSDIIIFIIFTLRKSFLFRWKVCNFIKRFRVNSGSNFSSFHRSLDYLCHMKISESNKKQC